MYTAFPDVQTIAEESTAWGGVSRPPEHGGLGFGYKWDLGWMHDTLKFLEREPIHRKYHHDELTFRAIYANSENYVMPLSHDEVVHGKGSLLAKMPGDPWQKYATLRLLYGYQWTLPGKKLLFMGGEIGVWGEWNHDHAARLGRAAITRRTRASRAGSAISTRAYRTYRVAPRRATAIRSASSGSSATIATASVLAFLRTGEAGRSAGRRRRELHAGAARGLPDRRAAGRATGARSSTPMPTIYGGGGIGNRGGMHTEAIGAAGTINRWSSPCRRSASWYSWQHEPS